MNVGGALRCATIAACIFKAGRTSSANEAEVFTAAVMRRLGPIAVKRNPQIVFDGFAHPQWKGAELDAALVKGAELDAALVEWAKEGNVRLVFAREDVMIIDGAAVWDIHIRGVDGEEVVQWVTPLFYREAQE